MVSSTFFSALAATVLALASSTQAVALSSNTTANATATTTGAVCQKSPYQQFLPLSTYYLAERYCYSAFPVSSCTKTTTTTKTSVVTTSGKSTVTEAPLFTTVTVGANATLTESFTLVVGGSIQKRAAAVPLAGLQLLFASAEGKFNTRGFFQTLCSCIESTPACKTSTATATTHVMYSAISNVTARSTSTAFVNNSVTDTVLTTRTLYNAPVTVTAPAKTITITAPAVTVTAPGVTVTSTVTSTVTA